MDVWRVGLKLPARLMISRSWLLTQRVIQDFYVFNSHIFCRISSRKAPAQGLSAERECINAECLPV